MSAILSADDLNDFISPGVACIKPVETLPIQAPVKEANPYEVTTEENVAASHAGPAKITLSDCLACSGCVTTAETTLLSMQSHSEVLHALDSEIVVPYTQLKANCESASCINGSAPHSTIAPWQGRVFVASVCPQVRASLAATYGMTEGEAGHMIEQLLCSPQGIASGGVHGNRFSWVFDTNAMRAVHLALEADALLPTPGMDMPATKSPRLTSACPGWVCYVEKKEAHVLPHFSPVKSPQALTGTLVKSVLAAKLGLAPHQIWHLAIMPCFDKKLEAARGELTDAHWYQKVPSTSTAVSPVRDVDCVITTREILMLADARGIQFPRLPRTPLSERIPFPDPVIDSFCTNPLFQRNGKSSSGSSGGYLWHVLCAQQAHYPGSTIQAARGRRPDEMIYSVVRDQVTYFRAARLYGFRNIQNLLHKLRPAVPSRLRAGNSVYQNKGIGRLSNGNRSASASAKVPIRKADDPSSYAYIEVMACPGGCTNGGGQIKVDDLSSLQAVERGALSDKEWLGLVDETYFSGDEEPGQDAMELDDASSHKTASSGGRMIDGIPHGLVHEIVAHWSAVTGIPPDKLLYTTFNAVQSDTEPSSNAEAALKNASDW